MPFNLPLLSLPVSLFPTPSLSSLQGFNTPCFTYDCAAYANMVDSTAKTIGCSAVRPATRMGLHGCVINLIPCNDDDASLLAI